MNIKNELFELKRHFLKLLIGFLFFTVVLCIIPVSFETVGGFVLPTLSKNATQSLSTQFFIKVKNDLLPKDVELISMSPIAVFITQIKISLLGAFLLTLPSLLVTLFRYLSPALFSRERKIFFTFVPLLSILFSLGVVFSYLFLLAPMFTTLLSFNTNLGLKPYLAVDEFISWAVTSLFITGTLFLLPIFMYVLTVCGATTAKFWAKHWREAFMIFLMIGSIVTPDVSGLSVILLTVPGVILYSLGVFFSFSFERGHRN